MNVVDLRLGSVLHIISLDLVFFESASECIANLDYFFHVRQKPPLCEKSWLAHKGGGRYLGTGQKKSFYREMLGNHPSFLGIEGCNVSFVVYLFQEH